jgi:hypothetical protein
MEWSGMGEMEGEGERNGRMGDWRGSGMGGEGLEIPIYIHTKTLNAMFKLLSVGACMASMPVELAD